MRGVTRHVCQLVFLFAMCLTAPIAADEVTPLGHKLSKELDALDVENHWKPGHSVAWKTGKLLDPPSEYRKSNTHCSAFVAAACLKMDIYILRPPEHPTKNLANAQADWLDQHGKEFGWTHVKGSVEAQRLANQGHVVVAVFKETAPDRNGHIAILRPSEKTVDAIHHEGPQVIQAGGTNSNSTSAKIGFKNHHGAFPDGIRYYVHKKQDPSK